MVDIVSSAASALQATLTGDLLKALSSALASGSVTSAPASIQNATAPVAISGTLVSQVADGSAVVQTAAGPVTLALDKPPVLPQGTLTLLIQPGNPPTASIVAQQVVTQQAQIQTQATAAQQTQDVQSAPATVLPPLAVGQVLTATPLPATAPIVAGPNAPIQAAPVVPVVVAAAASSAAIASSQGVELPTAVLLNAAIPPAPTAPSTTFITKAPFAVAAIEPEPEEEAVSPQTTPAPQQQASFAPQAGPTTQEDEPPIELTPQANALAAQESVNQIESPAPSFTPPLAVAYSPGTPVPTTSPNASQSFIVLSIETPDSQSPAPVPVSAQASPETSTVNATVLAQTTAGQPLLATQNGALLVDQKVAATPVGTELVLQRLTPQQAASQPVTAGAPAPAPRAVPGPPPLNDVPIAIARQQSWPALTQLLGTLQTQSPQAASFLREAIPTLGGSFAQVFTAFLTRGAPVAGSLPPEVLRLPTDGPTTPAELRATLLQLGVDLTTSATKATLTQPQAWQSHTVPILTDYGVNVAQLFVRQQIDVDDETRTKTHQTATRFLIEISPSQLGPVQLDGLLRKDSGRLDLIVRTEFAVSPDAGADMARLFQDALGATGMAGNLGFQTGAESFVLPQSDALYRGDI